MTQLKSNQVYYDKSFSRLDLSAGDLERAEFEECEFHHCNFTSACLAECRFTHCIFNHCNLSMTALPDTRFYHIGFNECKLVGTDWTKASWPTFDPDPELSFSKSILTNASFFGLKLHGFTAYESKLHDVDFRECDLTHASITSCDLAGTLFHHTLLSAADFSDSWDFNINVLNNRVAHAKFSRLEALALLESLGIELVD